MINKKQLRDVWSETLRSEPRTIDPFDEVASAVVQLYFSDPGFRQHIVNRSKQVAEVTGVAFEADKFDIRMARAFVADEIGFDSWNSLEEAVVGEQGQPILFCYAKAAMKRGDFTSLEETIGPDNFREQITAWFNDGLFQDEQATLDEILSAACMLGRTETAAFLIDNAVDPYSGMKTWLAGPHHAVSSGHFDTVKMLLGRNIPLEVKNLYGGTVLGQALWSAINEHRPEHADIIEALIMAGSVVKPGTLEWWEVQNVPDHDTRERVSNVLKSHAEFHSRVEAAKEAVTAAGSTGTKRAHADALKALGNILRRRPFTRNAGNEAYTRAADLYRGLGLPLEEAWVKRHIGINLEYAERLEDAEKMYDNALELCRQHATEDTLDYANAVRYAAVVKNRLGKRDESAELWEEAHDRYAKIGPGGLGEGVAEAAAWLTNFALDKDDLELARKWFIQASKASAASGDPETHKFIAEVESRLESRGEG